MLIIGLTGSIGMGKSEIAAYFRKLNIPVLDADKEVHRLYETTAVPLIAGVFPETVTDGKIDRNKLSQILLRNPEAFKKLEDIVHPLVRYSIKTFIGKCHLDGQKNAVLEVPLLFETGGDRAVDVSVVASAPLEIQRKRVFERPGMTEEKFNSILSQQLGDDEKRKRANYVVDTSGTIAETHRQVDMIIESLKTQKAEALEYWLRAPGQPPKI